MRLLPSILTVVLTLSTTVAFAQSAEYVGADYLDLLQGMLVGNIGVAVGLFMTVIGLLTMVLKDVKAGALIILGGVLVTLSPGIFNAVRNLLTEVLGTIDASSSSADFTVNR